MGSQDLALADKAIAHPSSHLSMDARCGSGQVSRILANPANMMNNIGIQTDTVEVCNTATTQVSRQTLWKCATLEVSKE